MIVKDAWVKLTEDVEGLNREHVFYVLIIDNEKQECAIMSFVPDNSPLKVVPFSILRLADLLEAVDGRRLQSIWEIWQKIGRAVNQYKEGDVVVCKNENDQLGFIVGVADGKVRVDLHRTEYPEPDWHDVDNIRLVSRTEDVHSRFRLH